MLMRDANNGTLDVYEISHNAIVTATRLGAVGSEWSFLGVGDFSGNPGETDMLMRNVNTGEMDVYNLQNTEIVSATRIAAIGTEWSVVGIGDFDGNAADTDVVTHDSLTGAFEFYVFRNETMVSASPLATAGTDWQAVGVAPYRSAAAATTAASAAGPEQTDLQGPLDPLSAALPQTSLAGLMSPGDPTGLAGSGAFSQIQSLTEPPSGLSATPAAPAASMLPGGDTAPMLEVNPVFHA
jgi:hypothetical protein